MSGKTTIEWTDRTWNPLIGCSHVSAGCDNCYAAQFALRNLADYAGLASRTPDGPRFTGELRMRPKDLDAPLRWKKPQRIFVNSMSDLFHRDVPTAFQEDVFGVMARAQHHTFQVLTKRPLLMREWFEHGLRAGWVHWAPVMDGVPGCVKMRAEEWPGWPLPNVWLGTSIENNHYCFRADHLRATPAAVRFLSLEPLLGPLPSLNLEGIDWVIVGGESGPKARPMHPDWVRDIRDRCVAAGVPFLFKQWGEWVPTWEARHDPDWRSVTKIGDNERRRFLNLDGGHGLHGYLPVGVSKVGKHKAGRELDGRTWDEFPEVSCG